MTFYISEHLKNKLWKLQNIRSQKAANKSMKKGQETIFFSFILGLVTFQQFSTFFPIIILLDCMRLNIFFFCTSAQKNFAFEQGAYLRYFLRVPGWYEITTIFSAHWNSFWLPGTLTCRIYLIGSWVSLLERVLILRRISKTISPGHPFFSLLT